MVHDEIECPVCHERLDRTEIVFRLDDGNWVCGECFQSHIHQTVSLEEIAEQNGYEVGYAKDILFRM